MSRPDAEYRTELKCRRALEGGRAPVEQWLYRVVGLSEWPLITAAGVMMLGVIVGLIRTVRRGS